MLEQRSSPVDDLYPAARSRGCRDVCPTRLAGPETPHFAAAARTETPAKPAEAVKRSTPLRGWLFRIGLSVGRDDRFRKRPIWMANLPAAAAKQILPIAVCGV